MPSRLPAYRRLIESFLEAGYLILSIETYWDLVTTSRLEPGQRVVILRHYIDTDPGTARRMWEIEHELGAGGSFFFRLSTLDPALIQAISSSGGHVSYHYEELATVAKRHHLRTRADVDRHLDEAQADFVRNIDRLRSRFALPMKIVASHGDFVNRKLGIPNWSILADPEFRRAAGIELETYDDAITAPVTSRHSDTLYPRYWIPDDPGPAIARGEPVIYLLVHPRHWRVARLVNAKDDAGRAWENLAYAFPFHRGVR
jgi:hypothetical protein